MAQNQSCSRCGATLSSNTFPRGLCPQCLLQLGLDAQGKEFDEESWLSALEPGEVQTEVPESIGPYRILSLLGEGGMGLVYLAEQEQPVRRQVAVKIIKLGMDTNQVIARFESERQALAMMSHPHIAKVLDAGSTEQGRPYFVMEYVDGIPITNYCDSQCLSTKQRLALFIHVCHAIQHAHQKGIIHRDVKPSNVLVETVDTLSEASKMREEHRYADATKKLLAAEEQAERICRQREVSYAALKNVWEKSQYPKGRSVAGREFVHLESNTWSGGGNRTPDLSYLVRRERRLDLEKWVYDLKSIRQSFALQHQFEIPLELLYPPD